MGKVLKTSVMFVTFAGLTVAMGIPNTAATQAAKAQLQTVKVSADAIPSATVSHLTEVAIDLPMPRGTHGGGGTSIDLPMPRGTHGTGGTSIDLPMPRGTHGGGQDS